MDALIQTAFELVKCVCAPVVRQICYLKNLKENVEKLREKARELDNRRVDVEREIERGLMLGKIRTKECEDWLDKVRENQNQVNQIEQQYSEDSKCVYGSKCPNCYSLVKLGKSVVKMIEAVDEVKERGKFECGMVVDPLPSIAVAPPMPGPSIQVETSAGCTLREIMKCLRDDEVGRIGVWGMGGVGKTAILKILNNQPELTQIFGIVIWVTVSRDWSMRNVQKEIAKKLSLTILDDDSHDIVKSKLFESLERRKFLLLLDDVWESLDLLNEVGVPNPTKENGCKLVLTARDAGVCRGMCTDREIKVNTMSQDEAWNLFREKVGEVVDNPDIRTIAGDILKECGGLPLVIIVVGASLRKEKDANIWKNALRELRSPSHPQMEGMEERVFTSLEFSYDRLKGDHIKDCFLYCALFGEGKWIDPIELIMYWWGEGFIDGIGRLKEVRSKGWAMLKRLEEACFLDYDSFSKNFKMHDVIRDLALRITFKKGYGFKFLVKVVGLREPPREEEWKGVERVSLMDNCITSLPDNLECPTLSTLLLPNNPNLTAIPDTFFDHMRDLRVLDLSYTGIESLPSSLSKLVNLRALYLMGRDRLRIGASSNVGGLMRLETLALSGYQIVDLSSSKIGELISLRYLDIRHPLSRSQCKIPHRMLSSLSLLEELTLGESEWWDEKGEEIVKEVALLRNLASLEMTFPRVEWLDLFAQTRIHLSSDCLMDSHFALRCFGDYSSAREGFPFIANGERRLEFNSSDTIPQGLIMVLKHADEFHLVDHGSIRGISEFGVGNMKGLKYCSVRGSYKMECVINGSDIQEAAFPYLERLTLYFIPNLRTIWEGVVQGGSLSSLRHLEIEDCDKLMKIFSSSLQPQLVNLETLIVARCMRVEEIIGEVEHDVAVVVLPKLKSIKLYRLPNLRTIWEGLVQHGSLSSLRELHLNRCGKLRKIFLSSLLQHLVNLEELTVELCEEVREIIGEEEEVVEHDVVVLPKLKKIDLADMRELRSICKHSLAWPSLEVIRVLDCPNLKSLPLAIHSSLTLTSIEGNQGWWDGLDWENDAVKHRFQPLFLPERAFTRWRLPFRWLLW